MPKAKLYINHWNTDLSILAALNAKQNSQIKNVNFKILEHYQSWRLDNNLPLIRHEIWKIVLYP